YYDSAEIGKPTGNDMAEGKLTLPVLYALQSTANQEMLQLALKVRRRLVTTEEITRLVAFTKENGGIEYAEQRMFELRDEAFLFIQQFVEDAPIADALTAYLDFVIKRNK
ncbi:MAG: polyprenyl synthetase family protein, partial [Prevotella sp.]|nr:polyprenyl synthetase family protein [Prevotella sp.]